MKKIVFIENGNSRNADRVPPIPGWEYISAGEEAVLEEQLPLAEVVVGWSPKVVPLCLENPASPLQWIQVLSAGVDHMPLALCESKGLLLTTASGVHANNISESLFAMLLSLERKLPLCFARQAQRTWDSAGFAGTMGEAHGKTMGILGAGAIGQETARLAKAFGMRVLGMRRSSGQTPCVDQIFPPQQLGELLGQCDYIVNILPHTPATQGMIGVAQFAACKEGAMYFSMGRGATTDTAALIDALSTGRLAGAGLDVTDPEPLPPDSPLWGMENVIITPHISGLTPYYNQRAIEIFRENLQAYLQGKPPVKNLVDYGKAY